MGKFVLSFYLKTGMSYTKTGMSYTILTRIVQEVRYLDSQPERPFMFTRRTHTQVYVT